MKLVDPLLEDTEKHNRVRVPIVIVVALQLCEVDLVHKGTSISPE